MLDYENSRNIFKERREQIAKWQSYAESDIGEEEGLTDLALQVHNKGIKKLDSLHIACAVKSKADYFLTTDDGILKKAAVIQGIRITDPIGFIKKVNL